MNKLFSFIAIFLGINSSVAEWNTKDYYKREHSLTKPYQGSGMTIPFWDFAGHTMITQDYIRLTADKQSLQGHLWNSDRCYMKNWEVQIQFRVSGQGKDLFGDGFAFWYVRDKMQLGSIFGSKDNFLGLAIFADTYSNHNGPHNHGHPYISAMVNNGSLSYDHDRDGTHTELAGCESQFRMVNHETHLNVRYENDILTVSTDIEGKNAWKECFKVQGVKLPTGYYFGLTSATGDLSDNHDIISVKTYHLDIDNDAMEDRSNIIPSASYFTAPREHVEDPTPSMSGFKLFIIMLCTIIGIVVAVIVGIIIYQKHQENSRKRFY